MRILVTDNFTLSYTKSRYKKLEEGACFLLRGRIKTSEDRELAARFIGEALKDPTFAYTARFTKTSQDGYGGLSSGSLDRNFDTLQKPPEGFDDGWFKD